MMLIPETVYRCKDPQLGPHNRCAHPVALPAGYRRCAGDPGCPVLIPDRLVVRGATMCPAHQDEAAIRDTTAFDRLQDLMEER